MVMGSASTMACLAETMGLMVPRCATAPAVTGERLRIAAKTGRLAVELANSQRRPRDIITRASIRNALTLLAAVSGSTNAVLHLLAIARRAGIELALEDFHEVAQRVPILVDCKPAGSGYLEDFHRAGGVPVLLKALASVLDVSVTTISGQTLGQTLEKTMYPGNWQTTIGTLESPKGAAGALSILHGSLAPDGAVLKTGAASNNLFTHRGPAVVFESPEDAATRIDDPALHITPQHVMVLRNAGPVAAGMPEAGSLPIPKYLAERGVRDMVRISDARMSGTAYGTVVLHCCPEAATGGPLALVRNGDTIALDVKQRRHDLLVEESEMHQRQSQFVPPPLPDRGWRRLYAEHVLPANLGADLDFL